MGPDSGKKVIKVEYDDIVDERTARRWKRRGIAIGISSSNLHCSTTKKRRRDNAEVGGTMLELDKDYERYWNVNPQDVIQLDSDDGSGYGGGGNDGDDEDDGRKEHSDDDGNTSRSIHVNSLNGLDDDGMDPQYKDFWKHVNVVGNSLILELDEEDGSVKQIRYEDNSPYEPDLDNPEILEHSHENDETKIRKRKSVENLKDVPGKKNSVERKRVKLDVPAHLSDGTNVPSSKSPCFEVSCTPGGSERILLKAKTETTGASRRIMNKGSQNCLETNSALVKENVPAEAADEVEFDSTVKYDIYQEFLNCVQMHGDSMVFTPKNCGPLIYEDSSSDADVVILNRDPSYCTPFVDLDSEQHTEDISQFRQGLMKDLKRPYNSDEYIDLLGEWSRQRSPKIHEKNLRNGNAKTYHLPGEFGKSYQETYRDLAEKLNAVIKDRPKSLNLLRAFFYWLKNVAQEGSFLPWKDSECLKVLRGATR